MVCACAVAQVLNNATQLLKNFRRKTILFVDEIHRFNKLQQDAFLPGLRGRPFTSPRLSSRYN
jgi:putative ATPase